MCDILTNEGIAENFPVPDGADNYLKLAEKSGLGVYERCDKSGNYKKINLIKIKQ